MMTVVVMQGFMIQDALRLCMLSSALLSRSHAACMVQVLPCDMAYDHVSPACQGCTWVQGHSHAGGPPEPASAELARMTRQLTVRASPVLGAGLEVPFPVFQSVLANVRLTCHKPACATTCFKSRL
jgi:hypothetical protein